AEVGSVTVLASSPQLVSGPANSVTITAQVKDDNNAVLEGVTVQFSATSGSLAVTQAVTDGSGIAIAQLSPGTNLANRAITVTAQAGDASGNVLVNVVGTTLSITGPAALAQADTGAFVAVAKDSTGAGINGATLTLTSANGNTISAASLTTDASGNVPFNVTATAAGNDTLTVSGLGLTATKTVAISGDAFAFTAPIADAEINLGVAVPVTVRWTKSGAPQVGETITFSTTRGTLSAGTAVTNGSGDATVTITSANSGSAVLTATNDEATSTNRSIEFVATTAATIELQASPLTVGVGEQSELTALVRDGDGNLVKNKTVEFLIETGTGSVSPGTDVTDSQGIAKSVYTAAGASAANGITVRGTVQGTAVTDTVDLTVARQALFIRLGTGNTLFEIGTATYAKEWVILVTDVDGNAIANKAVQASVRSRQYIKGQLGWADPPGVWTYAGNAPVFCPDEDSNKNGILDIGLGEDANLSGKLEAGNVALVAAVPESASLTAPCATAGAQGTAANVTTNSQGRARVCVFYPQNYAEWVESTLTAKASVTGGTEFSESSVFTLQVLASDVDNETEAPPNQFSPFGVDVPTGTAADCSIPPPAP
ncbi:MAG: Ig-like domain-containing protein, partial [Chromatiales bacterium]|nr:Ig-like domain-containing protein [Chromatiales bacterium]